MNTGPAKLAPPATVSAPPCVALTALAVHEIESPPATTSDALVALMLGAVTMIVVPAVFTVNEFTHSNWYAISCLTWSLLPDVFKILTVQFLG
jgi:hypothetical protein